jgi:hypothetical protein
MWVETCQQHVSVVDQTAAPDSNYAQRLQFDHQTVNRAASNQVVFMLYDVALKVWLANSSFRMV